MKKSVLFITCEEAHQICDKNQYGEATAWEKFKLGLRLTWCKITRAYTKKNNALTKCVQESHIEALRNDELLEIKQNFEKQLNNQT